ncbi:60s acidic ribosomal protein-domain-containing protein [Dimargaris cristalligena]|uniref:60s acidic ribosomal protein-domain-containing protein n=1 Tax=Dimargaris cristalligena TaxID=215637 RepID=A0A4P9ZZP0_9FUNG|nr:60s acidic ribosomal protein-domain-containing protein [Dimargaris cristalligena]|eukprot:RKP39205.1 60s acidic ribosomal protein-domain-containing protein [Dimargaris cristalligena]
MSISEKAIVYASLILADAEVAITVDNLSAIVKASGAEVEPIYFSLFAKALEGKNVSDLLMNVGAGKSGASAPSAGAAAGGASAEADAPAEEKKEEEADESDDDMGFGLFD